MGARNITAPALPGILGISNCTSVKLQKIMSKIKVISKVKID